MADVSVRDAGAEGAPRARLVAAAIGLLEAGGPEALQARRLAARIGSSTMVVYTHFGGMRQLVEAVAREGFVRLGRQLAAIPVTADPVADIFEFAWVYRGYALANPQLFRVMYGATTPGGHRLKGIDIVSGQFPEGLDAFAHLVRVVRRAQAASDGPDEDPMIASLQIWCAGHGYVMAEIAGYFGTHGRGVDAVAVPLLVKTISGVGFPRESVWDSARAVLARRDGGPVTGSP